MVDFIAFDFEIANSNRNSACAIGYAIVEDGQITKNEKHLICPEPNEFRKMNTRIHGICSNDVEEAPKFNVIWEGILQELFEDHILVAHYAAFDAYVLRDSLQHYQIPIPTNAYICSMQISQKTWPLLPNHKLHTVAEHLNIYLEHHDPIWDTNATAHVVLRAMEEHQVQTIEMLRKKIRLRRKNLDKI